MDIKNINQYADRVLTILSDSNRHTLYDTIENEFQDVNDNEAHTLIRYMSDKNLIEEFGNNGRGLVWKISPFGLEIVIEYGGWVNYLNENETEHRELQRLRADREAFEKRHIRLNTRLQIGLFVCAIIGACGVIFGVVQANKNTILEHQLETIKREKNQILKERDDLTNLLETRDKEIQKLTLKIDSLSQPPN